MFILPNKIFCNGELSSLTLMRRLRLKTPILVFDIRTIFFALTISLFQFGCATDTTLRDSDDRSLSWTRRQVLMLDDLYKAADGLILERYVHDPATVSAASTLKAIFAEMKKKGWHEARLIGLTDQLFNEENKPQDDFEIEAANQLRAGAASYEQIISTEGKRFLRFATPMIVSNTRCAKCHANFRENKGVIGSFVYRVPVPD